MVVFSAMPGPAQAAVASAGRRRLAPFSRMRAGPAALPVFPTRFPVYRIFRGPRPLSDGSPCASPDSPFSTGVAHDFVVPFCIGPGAGHGRLRRGRGYGHTSGRGHRAPGISPCLSFRPVPVPYAVGGLVSGLDRARFHRAMGSAGWPSPCWPSSASICCAKRLPAGTERKKSNVMPPTPWPIPPNPTRGFSLLMLSVATSIDALAVGLSFSLLNMSVLVPRRRHRGGMLRPHSPWPVAGQNPVPRRNSRAVRAELAGGLVLLAIGFKILYEHGVFGA